MGGAFVVVLTGVKTFGTGALDRRSRTSVSTTRK